MDYFKNLSFESDIEKRTDEFYLSSLKKEVSSLKEENKRLKDKAKDLEYDLREAKFKANFIEAENENLWHLVYALVGKK